MQKKLRSCSNNIFGSHQSKSFNNRLSLIEASAKPHIIQRCLQKSVDFEVVGLAELVKEKCCELMAMREQSDDKQIKFLR